MSQATGISDTEQQDRMDKFGENVIPMEPQTSIFSLMSETRNPKPETRIPEIPET